jgi:hypothetical protein
MMENVLKNLNAKYNSKGIFFTEGETMEGKVMGLNNIEQVYKCRDIGFPFKDHKRNADKGWLVPLFYGQSTDIVEKIIKSDIKFINKLIK